MTHKCEKETLIDDLKRAVFGNGRKGMIERVARLEVITIIATLIIASLQVAILIVK